MRGGPLLVGWTRRWSVSGDHERRLSSALTSLEASLNPDLLHSQPETLRYLSLSVASATILLVVVSEQDEGGRGRTYCAKTAARGEKMVPKASRRTLRTGGIEVIELRKREGANQPAPQAEVGPCAALWGEIARSTLDVIARSACRRLTIASRPLSCPYQPLSPPDGRGRSPASPRTLRSPLALAARRPPSTTSAPSPSTPSIM